MDFIFLVCALHLRAGLYERILERDLDMLDGLVAAEVASESAKYFEGTCWFSFRLPQRTVGGRITLLSTRET